MSEALIFLVAVLVLSALGSLAVLMLNRRPDNLEHGVSEFRRHMSALAPDGELKAHGEDDPGEQGGRPAGP